MSKLIKRGDNKEGKTITITEGFVPLSSMIPSGCAVLNCALSENPYGGYATGTIANLIGDSFSGKSLLALNMLAEACEQERFRDYDLIYDDAERALWFNVKELFGKKLGNRIRKDIISKGIEEFYSNILKVIKTKIPFLYVLDSFDALGTEEEGERAEKFEKGEWEELRGTYKMGKQKLSGEIFRKIDDEIKGTKSFLLVISQTRKNIGIAFGNPRTRSGGDALRFWSHHEVWLARGKSIEKNGIKVGNEVKINITKNKPTGKQRDVWLSIYTDYGVDDLGCCVDFLTDWKYWKQTKNTIIATELEVEGTKERIIRSVENRGLEKKLRDLVGIVWNQMEREARFDRKKRYE